jgi:hypothetical protein
MTRLSEFLWVVGGAGLTLLLGLALAYWIIQESLARWRHEPAASSPPMNDHRPDTSGDVDSHA